VAEYYQLPLGAAIGPRSHLFQGTVEEKYTFQLMTCASKIGERLRKK
jgi:alkaline phosphatase